MAGSLDPLPDLEQRVLERWRERDVGAEGRRRREGAPVRVIWERPAPACAPHGGELGARVLADVFARYATMRGWQVDRRGARDCHDPAVELSVKLAGAAAGDLAARCRAAALESAAALDALGTRLGLGDAPPRSLDPDYVESVWWAVKEVASLGRLRERVAVVPYCPGCATGLADGEIAVADVEECSAVVRFAVARDGGPLQAGDDLLVATNDPWKLVGNGAVAVDPELTYVRAKTGTLDPPVVVAEALVGRVLGAHASVRILERFRGAAIDGVRYEPPLQYLPAATFGERGHTVLLAEFVTTTAGTGLAAVAPAFSEDDRRLGARYGLAVVNPVGPDGAFDARTGRYAGRPARMAGAALVGDLRARGRVVSTESRTAPAPVCSTCATPLLSYAKASWYAAAPGSRGDVDALLSCDRCWGTPLPVWRCEQGHVTVVGSFDELVQRAGTRLSDPHRPHVDDVSFPCECGEPAVRVAALVAPWFGAAAMPFATRHEPFAGELTLDEIYPADVACAPPGAARTWAAALRRTSALLRGDDEAFEHLAGTRPGVAEGAAAGAGGRGSAGPIPAGRGSAGPIPAGKGSAGPIPAGKGSAGPIPAGKGSAGPIPAGKGSAGPDPAGTAADGVVPATEGADARRWRAVTGEPGGRELVARLLSACGLAASPGRGAPDADPNDLDRFIRSRLNATIERAGERLDAYDARGGAAAIGAFAHDLCDWYVPASRERLRVGDVAALRTLRDCLATLAQLLAPVAPFVADELYERLGGAEPSVHLCDWPVAGLRDLELEAEIGHARAG